MLLFQHFFFSSYIFIDFFIDHRHLNKKNTFINGLDFLNTYITIIDIVEIMITFLSKTKFPYSGIPTFILVDDVVFVIRVLCPLPAE